MAYETLRALRRTGRANALSKSRAERGLGWAPGSIDAVLAGGVATVIESGQSSGPREQTIDDLRQLISETEDELRWLNPKYESNRASLTAHLERRLAELKARLEALQNSN